MTHIEYVDPENGQRCKEQLPQVPTVGDVMQTRKGRFVIKDVEKVYKRVRPASGADLEVVYELEVEIQ